MTKRFFCTYLSLQQFFLIIFIFTHQVLAVELLVVSKILHVRSFNVQKLLLLIRVADVLLHFELGVGVWHSIVKLHQRSFHHRVEPHLHAFLLLFILVLSHVMCYCKKKKSVKETKFTTSYKQMVLHLDLKSY